jgi:predicted dehydrogenase
MKKLRIGIIGPGQVAQTAHLPAYLKRQEEVEVVALAGKNIEKVEATARQFGVPLAFDDYEEMISECSLDAISICTPNKFHKEPAVLALQSGIHVLCEKPPALTVEEVLEMEAASKTTESILTFNFHYRQSPELQAIKSFIEKDELGGIYSARVHALRRRGIPGWGTFTDKKIQGGGPLIDIGIHMLDSALYLMGFPEPDIILASSHQRIGNKKGVGLMGNWDPDKFTVEDALMGMICFKNGESLLLETSFALNMKTKQEMSIELFGDKGGASVFPPTIYQEKHGNHVNLELPFLPESNNREKAISQFIDSCLGKGQPQVTAEQGITLQKIIQAFYQSSESGEAIKYSNM